jgi:NAD(P) transhydrogenase
MKRDKVEILFDTRVESVTIKETDDGKKAYAKLTSNVTIEADMFLYGAGRCGNIGSLQCEKAGLKTGARETIIVDKEYRSNTPNIFAVGDVIGFPALASISMDQGRVAVAHMFGLSDVEHIADQYPLGMYTVPEVSMIGLTEEEALDQNIDVCAGRARYSDLTRGRIMGVKQGFLKLVFDRVDNTILGVHIIGPIATELIHFGMVLVESKKPIEYCISIAINSPTLHELYKYAAYDGLGNKSGHKIKK